MGKSYVSVAAKMKRLNIDWRQVDNNCDSAVSQLLSSFELPEDLLAFVRIYSNSERSFSVCLMMYCITNTVTSL